MARCRTSSSWFPEQIRSETYMKWSIFQSHWFNHGASCWTVRGNHITWVGPAVQFLLQMLQSCSASATIGQVRLIMQCVLSHMFYNFFSVAGQMAFQQFMEEWMFMGCDSMCIMLADPISIKLGTIFTKLIAASATMKSNLLESHMIVQSYWFTIGVHYLGTLCRWTLLKMP